MGRCSATAPTRPSRSALAICATSIKALIPMLVGATTAFPGVLPSSRRRIRRAEGPGDAVAVQGFSNDRHYDSENTTSEI